MKKHVNRNKVKITWIDPGKGHYGVHDGWGSWDKVRFHRVLGVLICKKHWKVPSKSWNDWGQCYVFSCAKCAEEERYNSRRSYLLAARAKGRHQRLKEWEERCKQSAGMLAALKEIYSSHSS